MQKNLVFPKKSACNLKLWIETELFRYYQIKD